MTPRWYVVESKPQAEALARDQLQNQGFDVLLPTFIRRRVTAHGEVDVTVPLFLRYLFVIFAVDAVRWRSINSTRGVRRILGNDPDKPTPLPVGVGERLADEYGGGPKRLDALPGILVGSLVRIREGALSERLGRVTESNSARVKVLLFLLGRNTEISLPQDCVEAA